MLGDDAGGSSRMGRADTRRRRAALLALAVSLAAGIVVWCGLDASGPKPPEQVSWLLRAGRWLGAADAPASPADGAERIGGARAAGAESRAPNARSRAPDAPASGRTGQRAAPPPIVPASADAGAPRAAAEALARDAHVSGRVVDVMGGAVAGARVSIAFEVLLQQRFRATASVAGAFAADAEAFSDERGEFRVRAPSGPVYLEASADAYAAARETVLAPAEGVELVLAPASRVEGRVESDDQRPLSGARVEARRRAGDTLPLQARTDGQGHFSIDGMRAGIIELIASAEGFSPGREWVRLSLAEAAPNVILRLTPARAVYGRVLVGGQPCRAGMVRAAGPLSPPFTIEAEGRYHIDGLPEGQHSLSVSCMGATSATQALAIGPDSPARIALDWELDAGQSLTGSVRRGGGEPVSGAQLRVYPMAPPPGATGVAAAGSAGAFLGQPASACTSDERGAFTCAGLAAGYYRAGAGVAGSPDAVSELFAVEAGPPAPVHLVLPDGGTIRVRVARRADGPATVFHPLARGEGRAVGPFMASPEGDAFVFDRLRLGRYRVGLTRALDVLGPSVVDVELTRPGEVVEIELAPPDVLSIAGSVVDRQGQPVPDAWVKVWPSLPLGPSALDGTDAVISDLDGAFDIPALAPGSYVVSVEHPRGEARQLNVDAGRRGLALVLDEYGSLSGAVQRPDGQPADSFSVILTREYSGALRVDGARGHWHAPWVPAGEYRVIIVATTGGATGTTRVDPGRPTRLDLKLDPALAGAGIGNAVKQ